MTAASEETMNIQFKIAELNKEIVAAHDKHYESSRTGLWKPAETPNGNTMYHLYSDGEIIYQKGGWAYCQRNIFTLKDSILGMENLAFDFPKIDQNVKETYAILTEKECCDFRNKMKNLLKEYKQMMKEIKLLEIKKNIY